MKGIRVFYLVGITIMTLTVSCSGGTKKESAAKNSTENEFLQKEGVKTLQLGNLQATWIQDNAGEHLMPASLFAGADNLLPDSVLQKGIPSSMSTFLVKTGGITILFDTGLGGPTSRLIPSLASLGIAPSDIRYLYLTHLHNDHIGGMMQGDSIVFPNAEVYLSRIEHDAWLKMPADKSKKAVTTINAYKKQLHLFEFRDTLPGEVVAMEAIGHTPGHTAYQTGKLLIIGDLIHGAAVQLEHPEICATYDMDREQAIKTRKQFLQYAKENHLTIGGMHLPAPAFIEYP